MIYMIKDLLKSMPALKKQLISNFSQQADHWDCIYCSLPFPQNHFPNSFWKEGFTSLRFLIWLKTA